MADPLRRWSRNPVKVGEGRLLSKGLMSSPGCKATSLPPEYCLQGAAIRGPGGGALQVEISVIRIQPVRGEDAGDVGVIFYRVLF